jgi:hypothetical protein
MLQEVKSGLTQIVLWSKKEKSLETANFSNFKALPTRPKGLEPSTFGSTGL